MSKKNTSKTARPTTVKETMSDQVTEKQSLTTMLAFLLAICTLVLIGVLLGAIPQKPVDTEYIQEHFILHPSVSFRLFQSQAAETQ